jgi:histidine ammonia-lyase
MAGAMTLEGLLGSHKPFLPEIHDVRAHPGDVRQGVFPAATLGGNHLRSTSGEVVR